ncbi:MAG: hypothetical protein HOP19_20415, partial [Acidobacteria bacterium]|nr:hypothetical protein [Acidobacteriota bacterium]
MKNRNNVLSFLILTTLYCVLCVTIAAQPQDLDNLNANPAAKNEPLATATRNRNEINWRPKVQFESLVLTVSFPDGEVFRQEFVDGQAPQFKLVDDKGAALPDGSYNYELRLTPNIPKEVKEALKAARANGNDAEKEREFKKNGKLPSGEIVQTGSFLIARGNVQIAKLEGGEPEASFAKGKYQTVRNAFDMQNRIPAGLRFLPAASRVFDQVIPDDLIVQGSACVGLDCVNNEAFGFDSLRLKENNTRIQFDDTSSSAGFPANNWQIRANSSASGGANFLAFVDQGATGNSETGTIVFEVDAGAPANSLKVSNTGRVGLRTANPVLDVHANTSNTPGYRLEQNNSGGFTAQTWDIAGNEANFFIRDVTGGSRLPFRIRPGAPTSSIDIAASGNVGIGTASPARRLEVSGNDGNVGIKITDTGISNAAFLLYLRRNGVTLADRQFSIFD